MKSFSIALLFHSKSSDPHLLQTIQAFREQIPFAAIYLYSDSPEQERKLALQKLDVTLRLDESGNRFRVVRRMFTEVDADIFVYIGDTTYPASALSPLVHQLVEARLDMTAALTPQAQSRLSLNYQAMCERLYGRKISAPLSDYRAFSRRFVKSFAAFERGFPIELEWSMHALELDIPYQEYSLLSEQQKAASSHADYSSTSRLWLTRLILNLQARPLKWFGALTALFAALVLGCTIEMFWPQLGLGKHISLNLTIGALLLLAFSNLVYGIILHGQSHHRREIKRLHFQAHRTL